MPKILMVHPYRKVANFWIIMLQNNGFEVVFAETAADALSRLKAAKFDLLIIEPILKLGEETLLSNKEFFQYPGLEVMRQVRDNAFAAAGNASALPIVVWTTMSAGGGEGYALALSFKPERIVDAVRSSDTLSQVCQELLGSDEK